MKLFGFSCFLGFRAHRQNEDLDSSKRSLERRVGVVPQDSFTELKDLLGRPVILLQNIAPTKTLGIQVTALILYAQNPISDKVELVLPRDDLTIASGTKVHIQGCESGSPDRQLKTGEGVWDRIKVDLEVNLVGDVEWRGKPMLTAQHRPICAHFLNEEHLCVEQFVHSGMWPARGWSVVREELCPNCIGLKVCRCMTVVWQRTRLYNRTRLMRSSGAPREG
ncbi:unnamed protein product, partial [Timema podura]|nr:unnamed protein product [Timema podura]